mmetsp:Transcript_135598/g.432719  ORF Transcript_135598/g.432719 Transcript_135598/m.432719 type:complete len:264 (+) Transcript_135598:2433-3224(+)
MELRLLSGQLLHRRHRFNERSRLSLRNRHLPADRRRGLPAVPGHDGLPQRQQRSQLCLVHWPSRWGRHQGVPAIEGALLVVHEQAHVRLRVRQRESVRRRRPRARRLRRRPGGAGVRALPEGKALERQGVPGVLGSGVIVDHLPDPPAGHLPNIHFVLLQNVWGQVHQLGDLEERHRFSGLHHHQQLPDREHDGRLEHCLRAISNLILRILVFHLGCDDGLPPPVRGNVGFQEFHDRQDSRARGPHPDLHAHLGSLPGSLQVF